MILVENVIESIKFKRVMITDHADEEIHNDNLSYEEIYASVLIGEIIEQYPDDNPYPSCLIYGKNIIGEPIHSVWAYSTKTMAVVLITVYRPDPAKWIEWKKRRKS